MRACRRILATALPLLATALAPPVMAESERVPIQFEAPKGCSDETEFLRALKKRTKRFELVRAPRTTRWFVATIRRSGSSVLGQLEIRGSDSAGSVRNVAGRTCDEVAAALALMAALAIEPDPAHPVTPGVAPPGDSPSGTAPPTTSESNGTVPSASRPARAPDPVMPRVLPPPPRPAPLERRESAPPAPMHTGEPSPAVRTQRLRWTAGFHANASDRVSPGRAWGGALFVETALPGVSASPVFRGGAFFSRASVALPSGAGADFRWYLALIEGCPLTLTAVSGRLAFYPCLAAQVGVLRAQGRNLDENDASTDVWAEGGALVRARVALVRGVALEAQGAIVFPLRRLSFEVEDAGPGNATTTVFAVPRWGVRAGIGVAYEFR
jgi:hypothetical protein